MEQLNLFELFDDKKFKIERRRQQKKLYDKTERGKKNKAARNKRYRTSPKGKASDKRSSDKIRKKNKEYRDQYLREHPCIVCGETDICVLDLHHMDPTKKDDTVSYLVAQKSFRKLREEIDKCIVLCAHDHRRFHSGCFFVVEKIVSDYIENKYKNGPTNSNSPYRRVAELQEQAY